MEKKKGKAIRIKTLLNEIPGETKFDRFQFMRGMGYSKEQIKSHLGLKKTAFVDMEVRAHEVVSQYMRYLAKTGHLQNLTTALQIQWRNVFALERRAKQAAVNADKYPEDRRLIYAEATVRMNLTNAITEVYNIQLKTPLAEAFRIFVKENIVEGSEKKVKKGLPLMPDQLQN